MAAAAKNAFPPELIRHPALYADTLLHLLGIIDSIYLSEEPGTVVARLEHKYWDYLEDYSIQDEVMFVSPVGGGAFTIMLAELRPTLIDSISAFPAAKKLFLVYGRLKEIKNNLPVLAADHVKVIDHHFYSTNIFSYEPHRNSKGELVLGKNGAIELTNFKFLKIPGKGQNK